MSSEARRLPPNGKPPPLQHGDRLSADEFERRWEHMPGLKKAELLDGRVYLAHERMHRRIDPSIPPLENGDRLTRAEFRRRWENMPDLTKAELLNGEVFMPPPVSAQHHGVPHSRVIFWLGFYLSGTPGVELADNSTLVLDPDDTQPDAMLFVLPEHGGHAGYDENGYVQGVPELTAEVSASTASYDLNIKLEVFRRTGIPEYIVWRVYDEAIDWFVLRSDRYDLLRPGPDGLLRSEVFPGLWLDPTALLRGDWSRIMAVVQRGLGSPEHAAFVQRLRQAGGTSTP